MIFVTIFRNRPSVRHSRDKLLCKKLVTWFYENISKTVIAPIWKNLRYFKPIFNINIFYCELSKNRLFFAMKNEIEEAIFVLSLWRRVPPQCIRVHFLARHFLRLYKKVFMLNTRNFVKIQLMVRGFGGKKTCIKYFC